jgi:hybrid cluster-associated redox disulfide protein
MITSDMIIGDVMRHYPQTIAVFERFGLDCADCQIADFEEVEHGASVHKVDMQALLTELNRVISQ